MKHMDIAAALALLFTSGVHAVPARNAEIRGVQAGQQAPDGPPLPPPPPGLDRGGAAGLVALPGQQITTGELQPLPGQATGSVVESSAAVETPVVVETSAALGEVTSEVQSTVVPASGTGLQQLYPSAGAEPTSTAGLVPLPGADIVTQSSVVADPVPSPVASVVAGFTTIAGLDTIAESTAASQETIGVSVGAGAGVETTATSAPAGIETPIPSESLPAVTPSIGGFQTIGIGAGADADSSLPATSAVLSVETPLASPVESTNIVSVTATAGEELAGETSVLLQPLPGSAAAGSASGSLVALPTTFATATASSGAISTGAGAGESGLASSIANGTAALGGGASSGSLQQLPGTAATTAGASLVPLPGQTSGSLATTTAIATASEGSLQPLPGETSSGLPTTTGEAEGEATATGLESGLASESASTSGGLASQTGSFASESSGAVLNDNVAADQNAAARDAGSVLLVSLVAGAVGFAGAFML